MDMRMELSKETKLAMITIIKDIKGLDPEDIDKDFSQFKNDNKTGCLRKVGKQLVIQIFGDANLIGNLTLSNLIKYIQYFRVSNLIYKKIKNARILRNALFLTFVLSIVVQLLFFKSIQHYNDFLHNTSYAFLCLKIAQSSIKLANIYDVIYSKFFDIDKIYIRR